MTDAMIITGLIAAAVLFLAGGYGFLAGLCVGGAVSIFGMWLGERWEWL